MVEADMEHLRPKGQGIVPKGSKLEIRWNSKVCGDEVLLTSSAPSSSCVNFVSWALVCRKIAVSRLMFRRGVGHNYRSRFFSRQWGVWHRRAMRRWKYLDDAFRNPTLLTILTPRLWDNTPNLRLFYTPGGGNQFHLR